MTATEALEAVREVFGLDDEWAEATELAERLLVVAGVEACDLVRRFDPIAGGPAVSVVEAGRVLTVGYEGSGRWSVRCGGSSWSSVRSDRLAEAIGWHLPILLGMPR